MYIIDSLTRHEDGSYERAETTRHTIEGVKRVLDRLREDPFVVSFGVSEKSSSK